jgi:hypothetical protein
MSVKDNIPADAITIYYQCGSRKGTYSFWKRQIRNEDGDMDTIWYWTALGDGGKEYDVDVAKMKAMRKIRGERNGKV